MLGIDYSFSRPPVGTIVADGYGFACRYLSWLPSGKVITESEAQGLLSAGVDVFLNWEFDALDCLRGAEGGTTDATEAVRQAQALGYPRGATIYHSADFDVTDAQKPTVAAYLAAARAVLRPAGYRTGCYSGYWTVKYLFDHGVIDDAWQTFAWSGGLWEPRAALRQLQNSIQVGGADCDLDETVGTTYSWLRPATSSDEEFAMRMFRLPSGYVVLTDGVVRRHLVEEPDTSGVAAVDSVMAAWGVQLIQISTAMLAGRTEAEWMDVVCGPDVTTLTVIPAPIRIAVPAPAPVPAAEGGTTTPSSTS
jgi:hypothetical protein